MRVRKPVKIGLAVMVLVGCGVALQLFAAASTPLAARSQQLLFQGHVDDANGLSVDGVTDAEVRYYRAPERLPADLLYAESFSNVRLDRGELRLPLLTGTLLQGSVPSIATLAALPSVYADVLIGSVPLVEAWPLHQALVAVRAEWAASTESLRIPLTYQPSDIPDHQQSKMTSGVLDASRFSSIPASSITSGTFAATRVPDVSAAQVLADGINTFPEAAMPSGMRAEWFSTGTIPEAMIPSDLMRTDDIGLRMGMAKHGEAVGIPDGWERSQCTWMVTFRYILEDEDGIDHIIVNTDANGVVNCQVDYESSTNPPKFDCYANYLTICRK